MRLGLLISLVLWGLIALAVWAGIANAATIYGTHAGDVLVGTYDTDQVYGYKAADILTGKGGADLLVGGAGADTLECGRGFDSPKGNGGADVIFCDRDDARADVIACGPGNDIVFWRIPGTVVSSNCEQVFSVTGSENGHDLYYAMTYWDQYTEEP